MKFFLIFFFLLPQIAIASYTPVSGVFSNADKGAVNTRYNLIVTANQHGQQFFLQCIRNNVAGHGIVEKQKRHNTELTIKGIDTKYSLCPAETIKIELDYESAYLKIGKNSSSWSAGQFICPSLSNKILRTTALQKSSLSSRR